VRNEHRRDAAPQRLASDEHGGSPGPPRGLVERRGQDLQQRRHRIRSAASAFAVGKVAPQRPDPEARQSLREPAQKLGAHVPSGAVRDHEHRAGAPRPFPDPRDRAAGGADLDVPSHDERLRGVSGTLYLGTSGFAYKEWKGPFYPETLKDREMLP